MGQRMLGWLLVALVVGTGGLLQGCEAGASSDECRAGEACTCDGVGACTRTCIGPDCDFRCSGVGSCFFQCTDGGCSAVADGQGSAELACAGGGCQFTCSGSGTCLLSKCTSGCSITCSGSGTCKCDAGGCNAGTEGEGEGATEGEGEGATEGEGEGVGGDEVDTCDELCDLTDEATTQEGNCVGGILQAKGYPIATTAQCLGIETIAQCNACYAIIKPTDAHCEAAHDACF